MENDQADFDDLSEASSAGDILIAACVGLGTVMLGGYLCGLVIDHFGMAGSISLWALGFVAGWVTSKLTQTRGVELAAILIVACIGAFVVAEICWIHWNIVGAETWFAALSKFPLFLKEFHIPAFIAGIFTLFGAQSAYRQTR